MLLKLKLQCIIPLMFYFLLMRRVIRYLSTITKVKIIDTYVTKHKEKWSCIPGRDTKPCNNENVVFNRRILDNLSSYLSISLNNVRNTMWIEIANLDRLPVYVCQGKIIMNNFVSNRRTHDSLSSYLSRSIILNNVRKLMWIEIANLYKIPVYVSQGKIIMNRNLMRELWSNCIQNII